STDGTVYAAFMGWRSQQGTFRVNNLVVTSDVVLCRDDVGATGQAPLHSLTDPSDAKPGRIVAHNRQFPFSSGDKLGQERMGGDLSLAVHPTRSKSVYISWG